MTPATIPGPEIWCYSVGGLVLVVGLARIILRDEWRESRGFDRLILLGPIFYGAPVAAFGTEHFTLTNTIAALVPAWLPWHYAWAYFVGGCFIAAALSLASGIQTRLASSLLALTYFLFVVLMDVPAWARHPQSRFALALALRELAFSGGALALAVSLAEEGTERGTRALATVARYFLAVPVLFYSFEQLLHADHVPGIPLRAMTPTWIFGHAVWTYVAAVAYAVTGALLLVGRKTRAAATGLGVTVLFLVLVVYLPMGVVDRTSLANGFNYPADTLMFAGAALLLAGAMPRDARQREAVAELSSAEATLPQEAG